MSAEGGGTLSALVCVTLSVRPTTLGELNAWGVALAADMNSAREPATADELIPTREA